MRSEFEFIRNIKAEYGLNHVGDDCAVLPKDSKSDLLITADLLVEDIDFRVGWTKPEQLGHKALAVSLSDIAAMGGRPDQAMLSIAIPERLWRKSFLDRFYVGWHELATRFKVELVGGDVSRSPDKVVIDSVVMGTVRRGGAILRSGARPGDSIFVTGSLGGAALGLQLLKDGNARDRRRKGSREAILRQLAPAPRVEVGMSLASRSIATSMIDVSDGLAADLHHLCEASGVGAMIDLDRIPIDKNLDLGREKTLELAIGGGEDFELLFTSAQKKISGRFSTDITRIGEVTKHTGVVEVISDGSTRSLPPIGYKHF